MELNYIAFYSSNLKSGLFVGGGGALNFHF